MVESSSKKQAGETGEDHLNDDNDGNQNVARRQQYASDSDSVSTEESGEDLILEGVLVRNPEVESSSDEEEDDEVVQPKSKRMKTDKKPSKQVTKKDQNQKKSSQPKSEGQNTTKVQASKKDKKASIKEPETITVEFTFNDMDEKYFHGLKSHLLLHPIYASHSSPLSDIMIENVYVGTVLSTGDGGDTVFGFASILNVTTYQDQACFQDIKKLCLQNCPDIHKNEMNVVLGGKTRRPAGFFMHGRMVNVPLEITLVLHEQLVKDIEWATDHAGEADDSDIGDAKSKEEERKNLNFGAFVLLAPCSRDSMTHAILYKNFDDEVFASFAEFVYTIENPRKPSSKDEESTVNTDMVNVVVLTRTGHQEAMKELVDLINIS